MIDWVKYFLTGLLTGPRVEPFVNAIIAPNTGQTAGWWYWARFVGLVNRLKSLVVGTTATIIFALIFGGKYPKLIDWTCLGFIFIAVYFMTRAKKKRAKEMKAEEISHETAPVSA
jgi:large-conductance mechanosensitive channel